MCTGMPTNEWDTAVMGMLTQTEEEDNYILWHDNDFRNYSYAPSPFVSGLLHVGNFCCKSNFSLASRVAMTGLQAYCFASIKFCTEFLKINRWLLTKS